MHNKTYINRQRGYLSLPTTISSLYLFNTVNGKTSLAYTMYSKHSHIMILMRK